MDHQKDIESTLNALLLNAAELQESTDSTELSGQQQRLLDSLFTQWNALPEDEKKALLEAEIETKVLALAKQNQACLREVGSRSISTSQQLNLNL